MSDAEWGTPITTAQACWAILKELKTPIVGNLEAYSTIGYALQYCTRPDIYGMLSSGEKRLVDIANELWRGNEDQGVAKLTGLDRDLRRKVWVIIGYLILGHDLPIRDPHKVIDITRYKAE